MPKIRAPKRDRVCAATTTTHNQATANTKHIRSYKHVNQHNEGEGEAQHNTQHHTTHTSRSILVGRGLTLFMKEAGDTSPRQAMSRSDEKVVAPIRLNFCCLSGLGVVMPPATSPRINASHHTQTQIRGGKGGKGCVVWRGDEMRRGGAGQYRAGSRCRAPKACSKTQSPKATFAPHANSLCAEL